MAVKIEPEKLKVLMRLKPTLEDTAAFFECSADTIERFIKKNWNLRFAEFRDQNMVHTRFSLIRKAIHMAEGGNVPMLIFCLKNLCNWVDKVEVPTENNKTITLNYTLKRNRKKTDEKDEAS